VERTALTQPLEIEIAVSTNDAEAPSTDALRIDALPTDAPPTASLRPTEAAVPKAPRAPSLPKISTVSAPSVPSTETSSFAVAPESYETTASDAPRDGRVAASLAKRGATSKPGGDGMRAGGKGSGVTHRAKNEARLMAWTAACSDLFPHESRVARTELTVTLAVDPEGHAKLVHLDRSHPLVRQFAPAAQACTKRLRFAPARDAGGDATASVAKVKLVFRRES
jgi:hypothetical protein